MASLRHRMPPADGITVRQKSRAFFQQHRSKTAATRSRRDVRFAPESCRGCRRQAWQLMADFVAESVFEGHVARRGDILGRAKTMVLRQPHVGAAALTVSEPLGYELNALLTPRTRQV